MLDIGFTKYSFGLLLRVRINNVCAGFFPYVKFDEKYFPLVRASVKVKTWPQIRLFRLDFDTVSLFELVSVCGL